MAINNQLDRMNIENDRQHSDMMEDMKSQRQKWKLDFDKLVENLNSNLSQIGRRVNDINDKKLDRQPFLEKVQ